METAVLHQELETLAAQLDIEVCTDDLEGSKGGLCKYGGRNRLLVSCNLSLGERVDLMMTALAALPLDAVFIRPAVREMLEGRAGGYPEEMG